VHQHRKRPRVIDDTLSGAAHTAANDRLQGEALEEVGDDRVGAEVMNPPDRPRRGRAGPAWAGPQHGYRQTA
jgi:hypothetical protein